MRERTNGQFINTVDKFKEKMKTFVDDKPTNMIFTEDLRNMIHLAEKNKEDIELVVKMLKKWVKSIIKCVRAKNVLWFFNNLPSLNVL